MKNNQCYKNKKNSIIFSFNLYELFKLGGLSGGACPKILTVVDGAEWIIKFPSSEDTDNIGKQEYEYSLCAKNCGIEISEVRLFPSLQRVGYFGTRLFYRVVQEGVLKKVHMLSVRRY